MSIIDKIKKSVTDAVRLPFYYDTPETLNVRLDNAKFPCALLHIVTSGAVQDTNGIIRERLTIEVLFATQSRLDFDGIQVEACELDKMKRAAFKWLSTLYRNTDIRLVSVNGTSRYYAICGIYSAYGVNVTIEEADGVSSCTEITDFDI